MALGKTTLYTHNILGILAEPLNHNQVSFGCKVEIERLLGMSRAKGGMSLGVPHNDLLSIL